MRRLLMASVLVASAARAQALIIFDDANENGFTQSYFDSAPNAVTSQDCHSGGSCIFATFNANDGLIDLSNPDINLFDYPGIDLWLREVPGTGPVVIELIAQGQVIGASVQSTIIGDTYAHFQLPIATFGVAAGVADGIRVETTGASTIPGFGGVYIDDVRTLNLDGKGGGSGNDSGFGGFGGFGGGGDFQIPVGGGFGGGGQDPFGFGGSGRFGGGADLGCNCSSSSTVGSAMTFVFGLAVSMLLRRRQR